MRRLCILVLCLLAACETVPRPFRPDDKSNLLSGVLLAPNASTSLFLAPIPNAPYPFGDVLNEKLAEALRGLDVVATTRNPASLSSMLQAEMVETAPGQEWRIHWRVVDLRGLVTGQTETKISAREVDYAKAYPETLVPFANRLALEIDKLLRGEAGQAFAAPIEAPRQLQSAQPNRTAAFDSAPDGRTREGRLAIHIRPVKGAPGDGAQSLAATLTQLMNQRGVATPAMVPPNGLQLQIEIAMADQGMTNQYIEITWDLQTPDGRSLGKSIQRNVIRRGELDGSWGGRAYAIAEGGLAGLQEIIQKIQAERPPG